MSPEVLTASIAAIVAVMVAMLPLRAAVADRRRDTYADAARALAAWHEFPYRVARRTSDEPAELARLAGLGHDIQEALAGHGAWLSADSKRLGRLYEHLVARLREWAAPAAQDAWSRAHITEAPEMNVGLLGESPPDIAAILARFARATRFRFGWRRLFGWRIGRPTKL